MGCQSATGTSIRQCVYKNEDEYLTGTWGKAGGYVIPYIDRDGQVVARRWKMFWHEQDKKMPKYLSVSDADWHLYVPPGSDAIFTATDYLIIAKGEKKAAKAVQEGFPCVALGCGYVGGLGSTPRREGKSPVHVTGDPAHQASG